MSKLSSKRKKMSECTHSSGKRSTLEQDHNRPKLRARRQLLKNNFDSDDEIQNESKDTPQMRALKEKMLQRKFKGNATKRTKIIRNPEIKDSPKHENESVNIKIRNEKTMTPQMRLLQAKIQARKSLAVPITKRQSNLTLRVIDNNSRKILTCERRAKSISRAPLSSESSDESTVINNQRIQVSSREPAVKRSKSHAINDKLKQIRTAEAPPGVSSNRVIIGSDETTTQLELNIKNSSSDAELTSTRPLASLLVEEPLKNIRANQTDNQHQKASCSTDLSTEDVTKKMDDFFNQSKSCEESTPNIYNNAEERLRSLRNKLESESQAVMEKRRLEFTNEPDTTLESFINTAHTYYEEMEWEPVVEDRIFHEIQTVRAQLNYNATEKAPMDEVAGNILSLSECDGEINDRRALYIVIDTNVFLTNLEIVEKARDTIFKRYGRPIVVIPWTTIRELDFIKDDKTNIRPESLKAKARRAIRFLNQHFSAKHPRVLGQTPHDVALNKCKFSIECPDDEILQACLQIRISKNTVVLLSYDRNLCNKAMIHDIMTLGRDDNFEKIDLITEFDSKNESNSVINLKNTGKNTEELESLLTKELAISEELYEEITSVLTSFLTIIVAKEMENLFGDNWERYTITKPPWRTVDVLKCALKHWIAAVSDSFVRRAESILKKLHEITKKSERNRSLNDVGYIIQLCFDLVQCLRGDKHPNILTKFTVAIDKLRKKHQESFKKIQEYELNDEVGSSISEEEQEVRATAAFCCFKNIYDIARDVCGIVSYSMKISCPFSYNKDNRILRINDIKNRRPEVTANVNRLLSILITALEDIQDLSINHPYIIALYNALKTLHDSLLPYTGKELEDTLSPSDIYFCLKRKEESLKIGVRQLQELSTHFCRMATFQAT
ncbi:hypothetical protein PV328_001119 [Microctonus aethiopoides]|uniref:PIN domain-containing protein n=1 Tax=Microctonus aethiopoides TaxID=144406 RepID=A0AA39FWA6_9HYME|nr:hypothetical protein PV328_001119 [Microctonus aethiopoides]